MVWCSRFDKKQFQINRFTTDFSLRFTYFGLLLCYVHIYGRLAAYNYTHLYVCMAEKLIFFENPWIEYIWNAIEPWREMILQIMHTHRYPFIVYYNVTEIDINYNSVCSVSVWMWCCIPADVDFSPFHFRSFHCFHHLCTECIMLKIEPFHPKIIIWLSFPVAPTPHLFQI